MYSSYFFLLALAYANIGHNRFDMTQLSSGCEGYPENTHTRFLQNVGTYLPNCTASHPKRHALHSHCHENASLAQLSYWYKVSSSMKVIIRYCTDSTRCISDGKNYCAGDYLQNNEKLTGCHTVLNSLCTFLNSNIF